MMITKDCVDRAIAKSIYPLTWIVCVLVFVVCLVYAL
jgi:hypothetical protein